MSNIIISPQSGIIEFNTGAASGSSFFSSDAPIRLEGSGVGVIKADSGIFASGMTIGGNPVMTGASSEDVDTLATVTARGSSTTNPISALAITGTAGLNQFKGSTADSASHTIVARNSSNTSLFSIRNDGRIDIPVGPVVVDTDTLYIDTSNDVVGINQSSPSSTYALDVGGSIRMATAAPSLVLRETDSSNQEFSVFGLGGDFYVRDITQSTYPLKIEAGVANDTLVLESGGNVGIGTNNPAGKLDIIDTDSSNSIKKFHVGRSTNAGLYITDNDNTAFIRAIQDENEAGYGNLTLTADNIGNRDGYISFQTVTENVRIKSDGNVGIGTTNPQKNLDVQGQFMVRPTSNTTIGRVLIASTSSDSHIEIKDASSTNKVFLHSDGDSYLNGGNVGIGLTEPSHLLSVGTIGNANGKKITTYLGGSDEDYSAIGGQRGQANAYCSSEIRFINEDNSAGKGAIAIAAGTNTLTEHLRVTSAGSVGIGSSSPSFVLDTVFAGDNGARIKSSDNHSTLTIQSHSSYGGYIRFTDGANRYWIHNDGNDSLYFRPKAVAPATNIGVTFDETGRVGIGSYNPAYTLDVARADGGTLARFKDSDSSHAGLLIQGDTNGGSITNAAGFTSEVIYLQNSANAMRFYTDGTEAVRIDSSQRVGIGTNSVNGFTHINGRMLVEGPTVPSTLAISDSGDASKNLRLGYEPTWDVGSISASDFGAGWKNIVIAPIAGKVGIGTTAPHQALSVKGTIVTYNSSYVQVAGMTNSSNHGRLYANNSAGVTNVLLDTNGVSYFLGGNVGIGVNDPDEKLEVQGKTHLGSRGQGGGASIEYASFSETNGGASTILGNAVYAGTANNTYRKTRSDFGNFIALNYNKGITFHTYVTGSASSTEYDINQHEQMRITTGGSVGIGTDNPSTKLHIHNGHLRLNDTYKIEWGGTNVRIDGSNATDYLRFFTSDITRMTIDNNGKVGIGTTEPADTLQVGGQVRIDGSTTDGLTITSNAGASRGFEIYNNSNTNTASLINYYDGPVLFGQANAEKFRINTDGDLQIAGNGTSNDSFYLYFNNAACGIRRKTNDLILGGYEAIRFRVSNTIVGNQTERMCILDDGKVGIGSSAPAAFLDVSRDNNNAGNQFVVADTEGASAGIRTYTVSDPQGIILNHYYAEAGSSNEYARYADIVSNISNGAGSKMRFITKNAANTYFTTVIDNAGNVGIGTTNPSYKLEVDGGDFLVNTANGGYFQVDESDNSVKFSDLVKAKFGTHSDLEIYHGGNSSRIDDVGTGGLYLRTNGPAIYFQDTDSNALAQFTDGGSCFLMHNGTIKFNTISDGAVVSDKLRIGTSTQKGIGGNEIFTISGGGASIPSQTWTNAHSSALYLRNYNNAAGEWQLQTYNGGNGGVIQLVPYGGNVTIGNLTASAKLDIKTDGPIGSTNGNALRCESATGAYFMVQHGGKVGIQTNSPQYTLHIDNNGNVNPANVLIDSTTTADASISFSHNGTFGYTIGSDETDRFFKISSGSALGTNDRLTVNGVGLKVEGIVQADVINNKANTANIIFRDGSMTRVGNSYSNPLVVEDGGNVGIGTNDPTQALEVHSTIKIGETAVAGGRLISADSMIFQIDCDNTSSTSSYRFRKDSTVDAGTELMRIQEDGNVGIGTTNPDEKLRVVGGNVCVTNGQYFIFDGAGSKNHKMRSYYDGSQGHVEVIVGGTDVLDMAADGKVGIGTAAPSDKLHVWGSVRGDLKLEGNYQGGATDVGKFTYAYAPRGGDHNNRTIASISAYNTTTDSTAGGYLSISTRATNSTNQERIRVNQDGQVDIYGNASFAQHLYHKGDEDTNIKFNTDEVIIHAGDVTFFRATETTQNTIKLNSDSTDADFYLYSTSSTPAIFMRGSDGQVGIGTTNPAAKLHVHDGHIRMSDGYKIDWGGTNVRIDGDNSSDYFRIFTSSTERLRVDTDGNVGIGVNDPDHKLHVNGTIAIKGGELADTARIHFQASDESNRFTLESDFNSSTTTDLLGFRSTTADNILVLKGNGNVGIGTNNPLSNLDVKTQIRVRDSSSNDTHALLDSNGTDGRLRINNGANWGLIARGFENSPAIGAYNLGSLRVVGFSTSDGANISSELARFDFNNSRVGIGSNAPAEALDVVGLIRFGHTRADNAQKIARLLVPEYNNSHGQFVAFMGTANQTSNAVSYGGGTSSADAATTLLFYTASAVNTTVGTERMRITSAGNVGIGVSSDPSSKLHVNGELTASTKTFDIEHPTQSGKRLVHGCFEGPEHGVYFRGKTQDSGIQAPEYWSGLVDMDSMTVDVTPIGANQSIYVDRIEDNGDVYVGANTEVPLNYFYIVYGERKDIDPLVVVKDAPVASPNEHID